MKDIRGLTVSHPALGWSLVLGVVTIVGLPPMGIFMSEFLIITTTFARAPVLAVVLALGLLIALGALLYRLNGMAFGDAYGSNAPARASYVPLFTQLAMVLAAGLYLPPVLVTWFQHVAELLG
jgi:hydrogenase-4 component F